MFYGVCIHFSLPLSCLLCRGALYAHVWSMAVMSRGFNSHSFIKQGGLKRFIVSSSRLSSHQLYSLSHRRNVASLYIFYRYFHADCSSEFANCMPPLLPWIRYTRLSISSDPYSVHLSNARVNQYLYSFIPYTGKLWNFLPLSVFPTVYDLNCFKRGASRHL